MAGPATAAPRAAPEAFVVPVEVARVAAATDARDGTDLGRAAGMAREATGWQAGVMGLTMDTVRSGPGHERPSEAVLALAARRGIDVGPAEARAIRGLDGLPSPVARALADAVYSFLAFQRAARVARPGTPAFGSLLAARNRLLDSAVALDVAVGVGTRRLSAAPVALCPAVSIDVAGAADTYTADCALIVDVGGHDTYHNNAGGSFGLVSAALIDLAGDDRYGDLASPSSGGANGGAAGGLFIATAGFLVDGGGSDRYVAGSSGVNGGGSATGSGFLLDAGGHDTYAAGSDGANGGGSLFGSGLLVDAGGNDGYTANDAGANGGSFAATGALVDGGGDDTYVGDTLGSNGGTYAGDALLVDRAGNDSYTAGAEGSNGTAGLGAALLLDLGGTDVYSDDARTTSLGLVQPCPGSGTDRSVIPKCRVGAQVDSTNPGGVTLPPPPAPPAAPKLGAIAGTVTDSSTKAGIAGARVDCGGTAMSVSTAGGVYRIPAAPAATLTCTASAIGYRAKSQQVSVVEGQTATLDFQLRRA